MSCFSSVYTLHRKCIKLFPWYFLNLFVHVFCVFPFKISWKTISWGDGYNTFNLNIKSKKILTSIHQASNILNIPSQLQKWIQSHKGMLGNASFNIQINLIFYEPKVMHSFIHFPWSSHNPCIFKEYLSDMQKFEFKRTNKHAFF